MTKANTVERLIADYVRFTDRCWIWTGPTEHGYGRVPIRRKYHYAHRLMYWLMVGDIPTGLTLDHLCRNTLCVNPAHLEPVTIGENALRGTGPTAINARKTHCMRGHPFTPENTRIMKSGGRLCKACAPIYRSAEYKRARCAVRS